jgi:hypothetical protein
MTGRKGDFDYDPESMDRLHYLMARLKAQGIYWIVDGMTSDNGAYGNVQPHRWVNRHNLRMRLYYDESALEHWKRLVASLWGRKNPYTGLAPLDDPAMAGLILVNEGGLAFLATLKGEYPEALRERFGQWLVSRYGDQAAFEKSWGREASEGDRLGRSVQVPREIREKGQRGRDFAAFVADRERTLFASMDAHVRSLGFMGLTTAYNNWHFYHEDLSRSWTSWVDMHAYQSLPTRFAEVGSMMAQSSIFDDTGRYGRNLANARQWGKPFTVTEYGQPFWNMWRHESAAWIPALAAFQDWDAICQFAELPVLLRYGDSQAPRRRAMYPFGVGGDPIARAGERLAALLFLRGDVAPSRVHAKLDIDAKGMFVHGNPWGQVPESLSRLALIAASGLFLSALAETPQNAQEIHFPLDAGSRDRWEKTKSLALRSGVRLGADPVTRLKEVGLLPTANRSELAAGLFETDTGQIVLDVRARTLTVATEKAVAFTQRAGSSRAGAVKLTNLSSPATVAVGAIDDKPIVESRRLLIWVLTDAINTGMEFSDRERTTLKTLGRFPPQLRAVAGVLAIRHNAPSALKVWAIDQAGRRVAEVPSRAERSALTFAIDNVVPDFGPVTYFEVAER